MKLFNKKGGIIPPFYFFLPCERSTPMDSTRKILIEQAKEANAVLKKMTEEGYADMNIVTKSLATYGNIVGINSETMFKIPQRLSREKKIMATSVLDKFLSSKWTTEKGRTEIYNKKLKTFTQKKSEGGKYGLSKKTALKLFDVFASDTYHRLLEKYQLDSEQIIDLVRVNKHVNSDTIIQAMINASKGSKIRTQPRQSIQDSVERITKS